MFKTIVEDGVVDRIRPWIDDGLDRDVKEQYARQIVKEHGVDSDIFKSKENYQEFEKDIKKYFDGPTTTTYFKKEYRRYMPLGLGYKGDYTIKSNDECVICKNKADWWCSRCHTHYCSKECQKQDWKKGHKWICNMYTGESYKQTIKNVVYSR